VVNKHTVSDLYLSLFFSIMTVSLAEIAAIGLGSMGCGTDVMGDILTFEPSGVPLAPVGSKRGLCHEGTFLTAPPRPRPGPKPEEGYGADRACGGYLLCDTSFFLTSISLAMGRPKWRGHTVTVFGPL
jgi:hypothetical protein